MSGKADNVIDELERLLLELEEQALSDAERVRLAVLVQNIAHRLRKRASTRPVAVVRTEGVCGGSACIGETRIPVWTLVEARRLGSSDKQLLEDYPVLTPAHLDAAWAYHDANRQEIEQDIAEQAAA